MNRAELRILRDVIHHVVHHNKYAWWELKRQIWESGLHSYYPMQWDFQFSAEQKLSSLPKPLFAELRKARFERTKNQGEISDDKLIEEYSSLIIEEVVRRASIAAYRTIHW